MVTKKSSGLSPHRSTVTNVSEVFVGSEYLPSPEKDLRNLYPKATCVNVSNEDSETAQLASTECCLEPVLLRFTATQVDS